MWLVTETAYRALKMLIRFSVFSVLYLMLYVNVKRLYVKTYTLQMLQKHSSLIIHENTFSLPLTC